MLKSWWLSNFKSICDEFELRFAPLTVIAGANSSGKSTILQSILLITQTLQSRFKHQHLMPNGELVRLGTPNGHERAKSYNIGGRYLAIQVKWKRVDSKADRKAWRRWLIWA